MMAAVAILAVSIGMFRAWWKAHQEQEALRAARLAIKQKLIRAIGEAGSAEEWVGRRPILPGETENRLSHERLRKMEAEVARILPADP
jgi:hypothetical protein